VCPQKQKYKQNKGKNIKGDEENTNENVNKRTVPVLKQTPRHV